MTDDPRQAVRVTLDHLKPHLRQESLFSALSDGELEELACDMQARGLQHPIEILPDMTIVAGHQRVRAARKLGWTEIDVIVRHDLAEAGEIAAELHLICDNVRRRQMGKLERARCAERLMQLMAGGSLASLTDTKQYALLRQMRESVGRMLGIGEREVTRLMQIVGAPIEVQGAYDRGQIGIADVNRVSRSGEEKKEKLAAAIRGGESPKDAIRRICGGGLPRREPTEKDQAYLNLLRATQAAIEVLGPRPERITEVAMPRNQRHRALREGKELLQRLQVCESDLVRGQQPSCDDPPPGCSEETAEQELREETAGEDECGSAA